MPAATPDEPAASRADRLRRTLGFVLAPIVFIVLLVVPSELAPVAQRLAAVFGLVIVLWVTEAIPLAATALLGPALAVPLGIASAREAFASFGHPIIFLFLGSFIIAGAMREHGLDRRIALFVLSRRVVGESPTRILLAFGGIGAVLSMWMSNTATTAMMLPIGLGVLSTLSARDDRDPATTRRYATGLMLMIAYGCNVGGIATPVGTPPNLIAVGMIEEVLGRRLGFIQWMAFGLPVAIVLFVFLFFVIHRLFRAGDVELTGAADRIRRERSGLGPWRPGERAALFAFALAVVLWTLPGLLALFTGAGHPVAQRIQQILPDEGPSAILAAVSLFFIPIDRRAGKFALDWRQAARIDWGTILLFGGGLSLGSLAFSTGLAEALGGRFLSVTGGLPLLAVALLGLFLANGMTEFMSNTATANLLVPMFLALGVASAGAAPLPALAVTVGCSLAFCFPVATPPNAIVYGSGRVPLLQMIRAGIWLDVGCGLLAWAVLGLLIR
jgi:sodium-dependent dicarboxylate transporter 2/3/5